MTSHSAPQPLVFTLGHDELVVRRRYEVISIVNDVLVAVWFLIGSVLFLWSSTTEAGTWLFIAGSVELMIRPLIRLSRRVHLQRMPRGEGGPPSDADQKVRPSGVKPLRQCDQRHVTSLLPRYGAPVSGR